MCNLIYMHLRPARHHPDCRTDCHDDCPVQAFHVWLDAPLTAEDHRRQAERRARSEAVMRGELPGR